MPPNFMVRSQVPTSFLRTSCSGPGLGPSWARAAGATSKARATAQTQRTAFIGTPFERVTGSGALHPHDAGRGFRQPAGENADRARVGRGCTSGVAGPVAQLRTGFGKVTDRARDNARATTFVGRPF